MYISTHSARLKISATLLLGITSLLVTPIVIAKPVLEFDLTRSVACRDVTPPEFTQHYPDHRIVECALRLSVYLVSGSIDEVEAIRVEIGDNDARLKVYSFAPATRLECQYAGDIETTRTLESSRSLAATLGGEMPAGFGGLVANLTPTVNGAAGDKELFTETSKRIAPRHAVIASGTINDERGVFFILRPSPVNSLEGRHELTVQFVVPAEWRSEHIQVNCRATGEQKILWMKRHKVWVQESMSVTLNLWEAAGRRVAFTDWAQLPMLGTAKLEVGQQ